MKDSVKDVAQRFPLMRSALPSPAQSPLANMLRGTHTQWNADHAKLTSGHADLAELMHSARALGGELIKAQLAYLWPKADVHSLALAQGLGVALWLTEMLLFLREDAGEGRMLLPRDSMRKHMVEAEQLTTGKHDFALRRQGEQLAAQSMKILQGSAPLGLTAPLHLRYRLRWTMLYAGFILQEMQRDPKAPFIHPTLSFKDRLLLLKNTLFIRSTSKQAGGSCGSGGCST
ncbi:MAG: hypothetical protein B7Y40_02555 [Gammaproteobacteria bacterium 28-57-27]|nr:MAG: hypothetical protein B7Y40_02555 [Gammaproteobacteria bacterium 28-57-27]